MSRSRHLLASFYREPIRILPYLLALLFGILSLRGVGGDQLANTDSARHAMNGAFFRDLILMGKFTNPFEFARLYYSHLPALSLPYHPPLFPAVESVFFMMFGVNVFAARLTVAAAVATTLVLLYQLIHSTHESRALALLASVGFASLKLSQELAQQVLLEFPMMVLVLASLYCLNRLNQGDYPLRRGIAFGLLAGAAVWTKQHAVFLGLVPFIVVVLSRRWALLRQKTIWLSSAIFGLIVLVWLGLCSWFFDGTGVHHTTLSYPTAVGNIFLRNLHYYMRGVVKELGLLPASFMGISFVAYSIIPYCRKQHGSRNDLYIAWIVAAFALLMFLGDITPRYLFMLYPPLMVLGYLAISDICGLFMSPRRVWVIPATVALVFLLIGIFRMPRSYLHGPAEAAEHVVAAKHERVLYSGQTDGSFIFAVRSLDRSLNTVVIRGEKLPASTFTCENIETFAHEYGIQTIILEDTVENKGWRYTKEPSPWRGLRTSASPSMVLEKVIPLTSSIRSLNGKLYVYSFSNPSMTPKSTLRAPSHLIRGWVDLEYQQD